MEAKKTPSADLHLKRPLFFSCSLAISLALVITAFEWRVSLDNNQVSFHQQRFAEDIIDVPVTVQAPSPPKPIYQPKIVEVPNEEQVKEEIQITIDQEIVADFTPNEPVKIESLPEEEEIGDDIFIIVESQPQFIGGEAALYRYLGTNIKYPDKAKRMAIEGRVFIKAVIEKDGSVSNVQVLKGIGGGCDEEAIRVIAQMPKWNPGKQRGQPARVSMTFPIVFKLG